MLVVAEVRNAVTAAPASASLTGVAPSRPAAPSAYTTTEVTAAPTRANHTYPLRRGDAEHEDPEHDREGRARAHAEDAGVGERVAREPLHERTGQPQRHPDDQREHRARQAQLGDDDVGLAGRVEGRQRPEDVRRRHRRRADGEAGQHERTEHPDGDEEAAGAGPDETSAPRRRAASSAACGAAGSVTTEVAVLVPVTTPASRPCGRNSVPPPCLKW